MPEDNLYIPVVAICPVRELPDHRSEMTSQLLLGEQVRILNDSDPYWLHVKSIHDGYEGWCQKIQLAGVSGQAPVISGYFNGTTGIANVNGQPMCVFTGTPVYKEGIQAGIFNISFTGLSHFSTGSKEPTDPMIRQIAFQYLNSSYLWGGRTPSGIDCSGYAQMVYRQFGVHLLRDAWLQAGEGESIGFLQEAKCGDLAFFEEPDGRITHVGILLNDHEIIHASGKVRVDDIDHEGILSRDQSKRTHRLRVIRRYFNNKV
jgi:gamma-D-glutamyl-L-lysine dipeptidyl-peptidase